MPVAAPFNFQQWIEDNRHLLKPPVGNKCIYDDTDFMVMVVGGPNSRKDYHFNEGEELFFQIEGDITVKIVDEGKPRDIHIKQGEMFLLPPRTPHSPQRGANTVGLVIERKRENKELGIFPWYCENCGNKNYFEPSQENKELDGGSLLCENCGDIHHIEPKRENKELDGFLWFCENCGEKLYEEYEYVTDIVTQLPPIFERFYGNLEHRTCKHCGTVMEPPKKL